jgi:hypothetical protein
VTDTALTRGWRVRWSCTADVSRTTSLLCKRPAPVVVAHGEISWNQNAEGRTDERGAGARGGAPARARPAPRKPRSERPPICLPFWGRFGWRFVQRHPPTASAAGSPPWQQIGDSGEVRHRWETVSSSTDSRGSGRRRRVSTRRVLDLASHLTERDLEILVLLYEHQILATDQLALLFFSSRRRAQDRLLFLHHNGLVDRFYPARPFRHGKPHAHWLLDEAGAVLVAARLDVERRKLGWQRRDDWGPHPQLAHRLEVNRFVTDLIAATLPDPTVGVVDWWGQRHSQELLRDRYARIVPDAAVRLVTDRGPIDCLLEWDRGTEPASVLEGKLSQYRTYRWDWNRCTVLFVLPTERLARTLYRAMAAVDQDDEKPAGAWPILLCTAQEIAINGPLARLWRPADDERALPLPITDLPIQNLDRWTDPVDALGRRWHKDRPGFWHRLSPLGAPAPDEEEWR